MASRLLPPRGSRGEPRLVSPLHASKARPGPRPGPATVRAAEAPAGRQPDPVASPPCSPRRADPARAPGPLRCGRASGFSLAPCPRGTPDPPSSQVGRRLAPGWPPSPSPR